MSEKLETISLENLDNFEVNQETGELHWKGNKVVTASKVHLGTLELWFAGIATASTVGMFVLALGETCGWW